MNWPKKILQADMSAPDHGALRPWRFVLIRDQAIPRLAYLAIDVVKRGGDKRMTPEKEKSVRAWMNVRRSSGLKRERLHRCFLLQARSTCPEVAG